MFVLMNCFICMSSAVVDKIINLSFAMWQLIHGNGFYQAENSWSATYKTNSITGDSYDLTYCQRITSEQA